MRITWNELTVNFQAHDEKDLLDDWRWLLGDSVQLFLVSSMGDMFLGNLEGQIFWLDTGTGRLVQVAQSEQEFKQLMQQRQNADRWL